MPVTGAVVDEFVVGGEGLGIRFAFRRRRRPNAMRVIHRLAASEGEGQHRRVPTDGGTGERDPAGTDGPVTVDP